MKPPPFDFCTSESPTEAVEHLVSHGDDAKVLAGGQSLVPMLNYRLARPTVLVDVHRVPSLLQLTPLEAVLSVGSAVPQRRLEDWAGLGSRFPALADALPFIGHVSTRNRGTVGGSLAHADPAAELPTLAVALQAGIMVLGPSGKREVKASDFFLDYFTTALGASDLLVSIELPWPSVTSGQAWEEMAYRHGDFALVGCAALVDPPARRLRLVYAGIGARPWEPRDVGVDWDRPLGTQLAAISDAVASACEPSSDQHASSEYRRRLVRALTKRSLARACQRAGTPPR